MEQRGSSNHWIYLKIFVSHSLSRQTLCVVTIWEVDFSKVYYRQCTIREVPLLLCFLSFYYNNQDSIFKTLVDSTLHYFFPIVFKDTKWYLLGIEQFKPHNSYPHTSNYWTTNLRIKSLCKTALASSWLGKAFYHYLLWCSLANY